MMDKSIINQASKISENIISYLEQQGLPLSGDQINYAYRAVEAALSPDMTPSFGFDLFSNNANLSPASLN